MLPATASSRSGATGAKRTRSHDSVDSGVHCHLALRSAGTRLMNDRVFFDTNVLVYVVGQKDERTAHAEALVAAGGVVSVQILNELAAVARRKLGLTWEEIEEALAAIRV